MTANLAEFRPSRLSDDDYRRLKAFRLRYALEAQAMGNDVPRCFTFRERVRLCWGRWLVRSGMFTESTS